MTVTCRFINGKDTGITVKNIDSLMPLPTDGSCKVQLQNKFPWGTLSSNEKYSIYCNISFIGDFSSNGQPYFNNKSYQIKLIYDETNKKWLVDNLYSNWFGDSIQNGTDIKLN